MKNLIATEMVNAIERVDLEFKSGPGISEGERVERSTDQTVDVERDGAVLSLSAGSDDG